MPVAGFWNRIKNIGLGGMKVANFINKAYKTLQPLVDTALDVIPYGSLVKPVLHGISTGVDVANNLVSNISRGKTRKAQQDIETLGDIGNNVVSDIGNTMYTSVNTQLPMNSGLISDIRNNSRQGFQSNQQAQPRQNILNSFH